MRKLMIVVSVVLFVAGLSFAVDAQAPQAPAGDKKECPADPNQAPKAPAENAPQAQ